MHLILFSSQDVPPQFSELFRSCGIFYTCCSEVILLSPLIKRDRPQAVLMYHPEPTRLGPVQRVCSELGVPLFVVSNVDSALQRVQALQAGVHQYYLEPLSQAQLLYDLGSVRYHVESQEKVVGRFTINEVNRSILYGVAPLALSSKQFQLLSLFIRRSNQVVSRIQIWEDIWGIESVPNSNTVDALVSRTRKRIPQTAQCRIEKIYGIGYRFLMSA